MSASTHLLHLTPPGAAASLPRLTMVVDHLSRFWIEQDLVYLGADHTFSELQFECRIRFYEPHQLTYFGAAHRAAFVSRYEPHQLTYAFFTFLFYLSLENTVRKISSFTLIG